VESVGLLLAFCENLESFDLAFPIVIAITPRFSLGGFHFFCSLVSPHHLIMFRCPQVLLDDNFRLVDHEMPDILVASKSALAKKAPDVLAPGYSFVTSRLRFETSSTPMF